MKLVYTDAILTEHSPYPNYYLEKNLYMYSKYTPFGSHLLFTARKIIKLFVYIALSGHLFLFNDFHIRQVILAKYLLTYLLTYLQVYSNDEVFEVDHVIGSCLSSRKFKYSTSTLPKILCSSIKELLLRSDSVKQNSTWLQL